VAFASHLNSLYRAIFVANVDTGEKKQVTDGLADAMYPVWDAGGKYLWFLASTDFGLRSPWLDMMSYDREPTFGLYLAVLKAGDPSPLLPESDEDKGVGSAAPAAPGGGGGRGGRGGGAPPAAGGEPGAQTEQADAPARAPARPVTVQIDFEGLQRRTIAIEGVSPGR
jgi:tricorn protease